VAAWDGTPWNETARPTRPQAPPGTFTPHRATVARTVPAHNPLARPAVRPAAPIDRIITYKQRMGWQFPYVSTYATEFPFDFGLALTPEQAQEIPEAKEMIENPPGWLQDWGRQVGASLEDGLRESKRQR
jgi:hypothetical protein